MLPVPPSPLARKTLVIWSALCAGLLLLAAAGTAVYRQARTISGQTSELSRRISENDALRRQIRELKATPVPADSPTPAPAPYSAKASGAGSASSNALALAEQRTRRLQESLAQSNSEVARLEQGTSELQARVDAAATENHRLSAEQESAKKDLAAANQAIDTLRVELKTTNDRLSQLETASAKWKQDTGSAKQPTAQLDQTVTDLEDLFRRREMYLSNVLRRYREITERYRAMSGVMDSRRDRQSAPVSSSEISSIQNAINLTEEDLRQIHTLDAQAQRLEKKLPAKK